MPFISDQQAAKIKAEFAKQKAKAQNAVKRAAASQKAGQVMSSIECVGAAGAMGFLRGKLEDEAGVWNLPFVGFDAEMVAGAALMGAGLFNLFGKHSEHALNAGNGISAHWLGQTMRKMSRQGKLEGRFLGSFTQVAGSPNYRGLPQPRTQMGPRHADRVAASLARAGF